MKKTLSSMCLTPVKARTLTGSVCRSAGLPLKPTCYSQMPSGTSRLHAASHPLIVWTAIPKVFPSKIVSLRFGGKVLGITLNFLLSSQFHSF